MTPEEERDYCKRVRSMLYDLKKALPPAMAQEIEPAGIDELTLRRQNVALFEYSRLWREFDEGKKWAG